jgi:hypothetical protein
MLGDDGNLSPDRQVEHTESQSPTCRLEEKGVVAHAIFAPMVSRKRHGSSCPLRRPAGFSTWWPDGIGSTKRLGQSVSGRFIILASFGQRGLERNGL